jgi:hypothetical protein
MRSHSSALLPARAVREPSIPLCSLVAMEYNRVMRGMIVRITTDRFAANGVAQGAEAGTVYQADDGLWRLSCKGRYIDADEADFEVIGSALGRRGVVLPSLNGGWLAFTPFDHRVLGSSYIMEAAEAWGREPERDDFLGQFVMTLPGDSIGYPVLWDRTRQLKLVYFFETPTRMTSSFPKEYTLDWPDPYLQIDGMVTFDASRSPWRKAAEVTVTVSSPERDRRDVSANLVFPAETCAIASRWLVDLFPGVTTDDLDWI